MEGPAPVFPVIVTKREDLAEDVVRFELSGENGAELPPFEAGAHIDVVVAPEYQRQYSLAGDPADQSKYVLGVLREAEGRGGSLLMYRIFKEGRRIFISEPRNHFPLDESAPFSVLMAGGIGVTPLITMAHRLHALGKDFVLHYSARSEEQCGFAESLRKVPWAEKVFFHFSAESGRADFDDLIPAYRDGFKLYTCGSDRYMDGVFETAEGQRLAGGGAGRRSISRSPRRRTTSIMTSFSNSPDRDGRFRSPRTRAGRMRWLPRTSGTESSARTVSAAFALPNIRPEKSNIGTTCCRKRNASPRSSYAVRGQVNREARSASTSRRNLSLADAELFC